MLQMSHSPLPRADPSRCRARTPARLTHVAKRAACRARSRLALQSQARTSQVPLARVPAYSARWYLTKAPTYLAAARPIAACRSRSCPTGHPHAGSSGAPATSANFSSAPRTCPCPQHAQVRISPQRPRFSRLRVLSPRAARALVPLVIRKRARLALQPQAQTSQVPLAPPLRRAGASSHLATAPTFLAAARFIGPCGARSCLPAVTSKHDILACPSHCPCP